MANFVFKDNSNLVLKRVSANAQSAVKKAGPLLVESVQGAMLYRYEREPIDTGALFDSIRAETKRGSQNLYSVDVGSDKHYAGYVHEGTYKMKGRPYIRDGVMDAQEDLEKLFAGELATGF